jgi:hypothetical protein
VIAVTIQTMTSPLGIRGTRELRRRSTVYSSRPCLRVGRRAVPLGRYTVVVEVIHEWLTHPPKFSGGLVAVRTAGPPTPSQP